MYSDNRVIKNLNKLEMLGILEYVESSKFKGKINIKIHSLDSSIDLSWLDNYVDSLEIEFKDGTDDLDVRVPISEGYIHFYGNEVGFRNLEVRGCKRLNMALWGCRYTGDLNISAEEDIVIPFSIYKDTRIKINSTRGLARLIMEYWEGTIEYIELSNSNLDLKPYRGQLKLIKKI